MLKKESGMRRMMNTIGITLIVNQLLIQTLGAVPQLLTTFVWTEKSDLQYTAYEVLYLLIYLFSFMVPVALFAILNRKYERQPMRLGIRATADTPLLIFAGMGAISSIAIVSNMLFSWADFSSLYGQPELDRPYKLLIAFVSTALVPAVCEEFLFRGCVLSNMLPYGKTTAIIGSSLMFALMHGNFPQFLYTFCAGIVLAIAYTETGSVWPGMLLHLFNNFTSILFEYFETSGDVVTANRIMSALDAVLVFAGVVCIVPLIFRRKGRVPGSYTGAVPTYTRDPEAGPVKRILAPAVIAFMCLSLTFASFVLLMAFIAAY